jgi:hypothetical protein
VGQDYSAGFGSTTSGICSRFFAADGNDSKRLDIEVISEVLTFCVLEVPPMNLAKNSNATPVVSKLQFEGHSASTLLFSNFHAKLDETQSVRREQSGFLQTALSKANS